MKEDVASLIKHGYVTVHGDFPCPDCNRVVPRSTLYEIIRNSAWPFRCGICQEPFKIEVTIAHLPVYEGGKEPYMWRVASRRTDAKEIQFHSDSSSGWMVTQAHEGCMNEVMDKVGGLRKNSCAAAETVERRDGLET